jgi:hypothetical protein
MKNALSHIRRAVNESVALFKWLVDQLEGGLVEKFKPFLKLETLTAQKS